MRDFLRVVWPFVRPYGWIVLAAYLASVLAALLFLAFGLWIAGNLDAVLGDPNLAGKADRYFGYAVAAIAAYGVTSFVHTYAMSAVGTHVVRRIRRRLFDTILRRGGRALDEDASGALQTRVIADTAALGNFLGGEMPGLFLAVLNVLFGIGGIIYVRAAAPPADGGDGWGMAGFLLLLPAFWVLRSLRRLGARTQNAEAQAGRRAGEAFRNWPVVHAFNQIGRESRLFGNAVDAVARHFLAALRLRLAFNNAVLALMFVGLTAMVLYGTATIDPEAAVGTLKRGANVATLLFGLRAGIAGFGLLNLITAASTIVGRTARVVELLRAGEARRDSGAAAGVRGPVRLAFEHVCYRYANRDEDALVNVCAAIEPGTRVAIVGPSGAGKSTLFALLLRLVEPSAGRILGNGVPADSYNLEAWRSLFGFVPQTEHLVSGSVAYNIAYGNEGATMADIRRAAAVASIHDFVTTLPQGYDTDLGEVGSQLSGGQRQRINLARAVLNAPPVYLLDEATSALDPESERAVQAAIDELARTATVIVIAHRLHTVRSADQILVMDRGRVVDAGDHHALVSREPLYQSLARAYRQ